MTPPELKAWRLEAGLTQAELAQHLQVDLSTYTRWERGAKPMPGSIQFTLNGLEQHLHHLATTTKEGATR